MNTAIDIVDDAATGGSADQRLLVCKTDPQGVLVYVNKAYLDRQALSEDAVLGRPLALQFHPTMPRAMVDFMWQELLSKREVFVYFKCRSRRRECYWVFANITPGRDPQGVLKEYFIVQRHPNEQALQIIGPIYEEMWEIEQQAGATADALQRSLGVLQQAISQLGGNYEEFLLAL